MHGRTSQGSSAPGYALEANYGQIRGNCSAPAMSSSLQRLLPLFERERHAGQAMVLATVTSTAGPTYSKPGAQMLIAASGSTPACSPAAVWKAIWLHGRAPCSRAACRSRCAMTCVVRMI